ncbi:MAG: type II toxin-antitoxin system prevent-host-death family antitoxin [Abditibacteriales bacterium]|nr:type II toxin-antitoxin system prevent-host-death family antitoxin [Abditibacteriales bacterium]MDW8366444.1 type II toxin-antitoxin system prevent-host-death family antitoxin [Abditibacteriales bacterium]
MSITVSAAQAKERFEELLEQAGRGDRVIIRRRGKPALALVRLTELKTNGNARGSSRETLQERLERAAKRLGNRFRLSAKQERRVAMLAKKNKKGTLTEAERAELFQLLHEMEELSRQRAKALGELR